ncbi:MAG: hypothetical protein ACK4IK_07170 [Bacteroidia bacterium]
MVNNYTLKTQFELIASEELKLELEFIEKFQEPKEPSQDCLNAIMQFGAAFNAHTSSMLKDVSYLAN